MMRLRHSASGFVRYMQMSRVQLFAFVEGFTDRPFYDRICALECVESACPYEVCTATELSSNAGGKTAVLKFHDYLRRKRLLRTDFKGKIFTTIFFVDKDVDDLRRSCRRSNHINYTAHYHLENYWFLNGDLHSSFAVAGGFSVSQVRYAIGHATTWRTLVAERWRQWVELCVFTAMYPCPCDIRYANLSKINESVFGEVDANAAAAAYARVRDASGMEDITFERRWRKASKAVEKLYSKGCHDAVFKGKWYGQFLMAEAERLAAGSRYNRNGFLDRLIGALMSSLDFSADWAASLRERVRGLIAGLPSMA
jgi:hypothetical protein